MPSGSGPCVRVYVTTPLRPSEDAAKVVRAATRWWPGASTDIVDGTVRVEARGPTVMDDFRARVWELRIIDTIRAALLPGCDGATLRFRLDKQAAYAGHVSLPAADHALGHIEVRVDVEDDDGWEDAEALAWWLCPATKDGHIVAEDGA